MFALRAGLRPEHDSRRHPQGGQRSFGRLSSLTLHPAKTLQEPAAKSRDPPNPASAPLAFLPVPNVRSLARLSVWHKGPAATQGFPTVAAVFLLDCLPPCAPIEAEPESSREEVKQMSKFKFTRVYEVEAATQ